MLNPGICQNFGQRFKAAAGVEGVEVKVSVREADPKHTEGQPGLLVRTDPCG